MGGLGLSRRFFGWSAILLLAGLPSVNGASLNEALENGRVNLDMRLRFEAVDDNVAKAARAGTLRTRLGYRTGDYRGLFAFGEFEDVRIVAGLNDYAPERSGYAVVADPAVTQLNQALVAYRGIDDTLIRLGRQRLILDNARFVGNVGWRQNEQTFDALSLINTTLPNTTLSYAYLDKVRGILEKFDANVSDHLINASYRGFQTLALTAYAYLLEDDDSHAENDTYGLRIKGGQGIGSGVRLLYIAEFAHQATHDRDADYTFLEAGVRYRGVTARLGHEVLGSDAGAYGLQTPLATKHAFNGWADMFLTTPADGLRDLVVSVGGDLKGTSLLAAYHRFSADRGGDGYGSELDLLATRKFAGRHELGIKYADYSADSWKTDTRKLWLWVRLSL